MNCGPKTHRNSEKNDCSVCDDVGDGFHFGAEACRACAAFFRRTVVLRKTYKCRQNDSCTVNSIVRSICKSCRLSKCLRIGMNPNCVQQKRDVIGRKYDAPAAKPSISESMPILERMRVSYERLKKARDLVHRREGESIFEPRVSRALHFREALEVASKEVSLVADWVEWCFDDFCQLPIDQKTVLFQNFYPFFSVLERTFLTFKFGSPEKIILASRDYVNTEDLEDFFSDAEQEISGEKLANIFKPAIELQTRSLLSLITQENMDWYEFFSISVLLFWDYGLEGQSEECSQIGKRFKRAVAKESEFYLKHVKQDEEPITRVAMLVAILPSLQRVVYQFRENISMAHIFDIYTIPPNFYNIINGRFV